MWILYIIYVSKTKMNWNYFEFYTNMSLCRFREIASLVITWFASCIKLHQTFCKFLNIFFWIASMEMDLFHDAAQRPHRKSHQTAITIEKLKLYFFEFTKMGIHNIHHKSCIHIMMIVAFSFLSFLILD